MCPIYYNDQCNFFNCVSLSKCTFCFHFLIVEHELWTPSLGLRHHCKFWNFGAKKQGDWLVWKMSRKPLSVRNSADNAHFKHPGGEGKKRKSRTPFPVLGTSTLVTQLNFVLAESMSSRPLVEEDLTKPTVRHHKNRESGTSHSMISRLNAFRRSTWL